MTKRARYRWLIAFILIGIPLAIGAWRNPPPGDDGDNQGGYVIVLLCFVILLCIYITTAKRALAAKWKLRGERAAQRPVDA